MRTLGPIFYREYKIRTTNLVWFFFDILLPILYLLLFGVGFSRAVAGSFTAGGKTLPYEEFLLGGVLAMASFGIAINTTWGWFMDRDNGIFYELLSYPMKRGELLFGKVSFNVLLSILQAMVTVTLGAVVLKIPVLWTRLPLILPAMMVGTAGWFFFFSIPALRIRRNDIYNTVINIAYFLLLFGSNMFYPLEPMPAWLRWTASFNPMTWQVDFLRYATIGLGDAAGVLRNAALFLAFTVVAFGLANRALRAQE